MIFNQPRGLISLLGSTFLGANGAKQHKFQNTPKLMQPFHLFSKKIQKIFKESVQYVWRLIPKGPW